MDGRERLEEGNLDEALTEQIRQFWDRKEPGLTTLA
jgi:hypothetical protein